MSMVSLHGDHGETFAQFCQRHGGNQVQAGKGGWFLLPDGAAVSPDDMRREEPHDHPYRRLQARHRYHTVRSKQTSTDRHMMEEALAHGIRWNWPRGYPEEVRDIRSYDEAVAYFARLNQEDQQAIAAINEELSHTPMPVGL